MRVIHFPFSKKLKSLLSVFIFIGFVSFSAGMVFADRGRVWSAFLTASLFVFFISLGGVFFTAIQHVSKAGWSVNIRRFMEAFSRYIPFGCVFAFALIFSGDYLYDWFNPQTVAEDHLLSKKSAYLNKVFFIVRLLIFSGIVIGFSRLLTGLSLKQDRTGQEILTHKSLKASIAFLLCFAVGWTFFSVDTLMSLEPHWFSTIFGIYTLAGMLQAFTAGLILMIIYFMRQGILNGTVNENHLHDLGKFLFGWTAFWAYIAFSQYMLIWYANLPEETIYYLPRSQNDWMWVSLALGAFKFIVPFLFLLPRWVKRDPGALTVVSVLILVMEYVDIYWMVYPSYSRESVHFGLLEVGLLAGFVSLFLYVTLNFLSRHPAVPLQDPREGESSRHKVTY